MIVSADGLGAVSMQSYENSAQLDMSYNRLTDAGFTAAVSGVKVLDLSNNFITKKLSSIPLSVITLDISNNGLEAAGELSRLNKLVNLNISGNKLTTVTGLKGCTALEVLDASSNRITETTELNYLSKLKSLDLSHNLLCDMPLHTLLKDLAVLDISYNSISNIALINRYSKLTRFYASHNSITDFSSINNMNFLAFADFSYNNISTVYSQLYLTTPSLEVLKLSGNDLSEAEVANLFANGYSELWLCDMSLENKMPDMSQYPTVYELYLNGSTLSATDIANVLKKQDYTGIGLGGIINSDIITELAKQKDLITLDASCTDNMSELLDKIALLNVINLNLSGCGLSEFEPALFNGSVKNIDLSDNLFKTLDDSVLRNAALSGVSIDLSGNKLAEDHIFYSYLKDFGLKLDGNYIDMNYDVELTIETETKKSAQNDTIDLYSLLKLKNIYLGSDEVLPDKSYFDVNVIGGDDARLTLDKNALSLTVNEKISYLDAVTVQISLIHTKREAFSVTLVIYTDELPFKYQKIADTDVIYGITPGTSFADMLAQFGLGEGFELKAFDAENTLLSNDSIAGTGSRVQILKNGVLVFEKTVLIIGDCSGDGRINSTDFMMIKMHIFATSLLDGVYLEAADTNGNGAVNSTDFMQVKMFIFNMGEIDQLRSDN